MPSTKFRNIIYKSALPFFAPNISRSTSAIIYGHKISYNIKLQKLLEKHHVLGSATYIADQTHCSVICQSLTEPPRQIGMESYFRVASITKMVTALMVLIATEQGKISLDDSISSFSNLKEKSVILDKITLRQILSHTSGIIDPPSFEEALLKQIPFTDLLNKQNNFEINSFRYSNLGFGIVGSILEEIYNKPINDIFEQYVFKPLNLNATFLPSTLSENKIVPISRVLPYQNKGIQITKLGARTLNEPDPLYHYGYTAGALYITIQSLYRFLLCLKDNGRPLLNTNIGKQIEKTHSSYGKISPGLTYGLGLLKINIPSISEYTILGHQGFAYGCADGAFWEEKTGNIMIHLNGGASEARKGKLGLLNIDLLKWALKEEIPQWSR